MVGRYRWLVFFVLPGCSGVVPEATSATRSHALGDTGILIEAPPGYELLDSDSDPESPWLSFSYPPDSSGGRPGFPELIVELEENEASLPSADEVRARFEQAQEIIIAPRSAHLGTCDAIEFATTGEMISDFVGGGSSSQTIVVHQFIFQLRGSLYTCSLFANPSEYDAQRTDVERFCSSIRLAGNTSAS